MKLLLLAILITFNISLSQTIKNNKITATIISAQPKVIRYIDSTTSSVCYVVISPTKTSAFNKYGEMTSDIPTGENVSISCVKLDTKKK